MSRFLSLNATTLGLLGACVSSMLPVPCRGHDENLHRVITRSAFLSSDGTMWFLTEALGTTSLPFTNSPDLMADPPPWDELERALSPELWAEWGSYWEDMKPYDGSNPFWQWIDAAYPGALRGMEHFYTVSPQRIPGQASGLTDSNELPFPVLPSGINNSFVWASQDDVTGPGVGVNADTWPSARVFQHGALTLEGKWYRERCIAKMLFELGHVLHLNQDKSQPDHVRNDNHANESHRYIENYGHRCLAMVETNANLRAALFSLRQRGWGYWRTNGFVKLLDFWDRGKYTNGLAVVLAADAGGGADMKLGLAEFSNGNYLGEDATYPEYLKVTNVHRFPFPSRNSSTTWNQVSRDLLSGRDTTQYRDGSTGNRIYLRKSADGVVVPHHSVLTYLDTVTLGSSPGFSRTMGPPGINDERVLYDYHTNLIPKAVEYSAGILDYFFRGRLEVYCLDVQGQTVSFCVRNLSGAALSGGTFGLYGDDATSGLRGPISLLDPQWGPGDTLGTNEARTLSFPDVYPNVTNYVLVYQGTIGTNSTGGALDPADAGIGIATTHFAPITQSGENGPVRVWVAPDDAGRQGIELMRNVTDPYHGPYSASDVGPGQVLAQDNLYESYDPKR